MLRRFISIMVIAWTLGFVWFAALLPTPQDGGTTDAIVVPTGGEGRIARGLELLGQHKARRMLVAGVDKEVRPVEFAVHYKVDTARMACCITLGFKSVDTRTNARETADWVASNRFKSLRLVTSDWHMRRAAYDLELVLPSDVTVIRDAVATKPSLRILLLEYHKLLARRASLLWRA